MSNVLALGRQTEIWLPSFPRPRRHHRSRD